MLNKIKIAAVVVFAGLISLYNPVQALAWGGRDRDRGHRNYHHHNAYPYGKLSVRIPHGDISFGFGTNKYYYSSGLFHRPYRREYIVVPPPSRAVVYQIPAQYDQVFIQPAPVVVDAATVSRSAAIDEEEVFTVNIPLVTGGYKAIIIKRDGAGFQGPQGEFYPEFPKVEQLKVMYAGKMK